MMHELHEKYSHKIEAFNGMLEEFVEANGRSPDDHEKAKLLSDAICLWSKEEVDIKRCGREG